MLVEIGPIALVNQMGTLNIGPGNLCSFQSLLLLPYRVCVMPVVRLCEANRIGKRHGFVRLVGQAINREKVRPKIGSHKGKWNEIPPIERTGRYCLNEKTGGRCKN